MKFWPQLGILLVTAGVGLLLTLLVSVPVTMFIGNNHLLFALHWMQWMQTIILMILAPLCWFRWCHIPSMNISQHPWSACFRYAKLTSIPWKFLFVTFCLMVVSLPFVDSLEVFMNRLPWPPSIKSYFEDGFEQNQRMVAALLQCSGFLGNLESFLLMCLGTAIGEELMFRGALLSCFRDCTHLSVHAIAWIIGFIFALIHFEPAGFVVRMILGSLLVYLVWWSDSLWPSILAHCMNNSFALIGFKTSTPEELLQPRMDYTFGPVLAITSVVLIVIVLYVLSQLRVTKEPNFSTK